MALTTSQVQQVTDSLAQVISDFNTNFVSGTSSGNTTITTGVSGVGGSAFLGRNLALNDLLPEIALLSQANVASSNIVAYMAGIRSLAGFYPQLYPYLDKLDATVLYNGSTGLNNFLTGNSIQVNAYFAAAFNAYQAVAVAQQYRTSASAPTALAVANYFPYAATDNMWSFTTSGATTFSANAVGANATSTVNGGGVAQFYLYKSNAGSATGTSTISVTYTNAAGSPATVTVATTGMTGSATLSTGTIITGAIGSAITAVTGTGMTSGEAYTIGLKLVRAAGY